MPDPESLPRGRVLIAAGSDSGGGAGIQADIKAVTALGGYAMTAITALTAQNTQGVAAVEPVSPAFVAMQMVLAIDDIGADAVKIGMLHRAPVVNAVADVLSDQGKGIPLVLDTVMIAKGGAALLEEDAVAAIRDRLIPGAALVTPNLPEAAALTGLKVATPEAMKKAGRAILAMGARAALIKGGHLEGDRLIDLLITPEQVRAFETPRIVTRHTHGTGCTLASACAAGIAQGMDLEAAVERAIAYVQEAIRTAPGLGQGHGPLNHGHTVAPFTRKLTKIGQT